MHNVSFKVEGSKLLITVDVGKNAIAAAPPSQSGKTHLVASTGGSTQIETPAGTGAALSFSMNVMAKKNGAA
jgi:hypothetical protein